LDLSVTHGVVADQIGPLAIDSNKGAANETVLSIPLSS
jgi:hypothetical protein